MNFLFVLVIPVLSFEYLSATIHSQDVKPIPRRVPWHPHMYLAHDESGDTYEIRYSHEYYDVSVSFLQTKESSPGVLNCECRFVKSELSDSSSTTFLQVITPNTQKQQELLQIQEKEKLREIPLSAKPTFVQNSKPMRVETKQGPKPLQMLETEQRSQEMTAKRVDMPQSYENIEYEPAYQPRVFEAPKQHVFRESPQYYPDSRTMFTQKFQPEYRPSYIPETYPQYLEERPQVYQYPEERQPIYAPQYIEERGPDYYEPRSYSQPPKVVYVYPPYERSP